MGNGYDVSDNSSMTQAMIMVIQHHYIGDQDTIALRDNINFNKETDSKQQIVIQELLT